MRWCKTQRCFYRRSRKNSCSHHYFHQYSVEGFSSSQMKDNVWRVWKSTRPLDIFFFLSQKMEGRREEQNQVLLFLLFVRLASFLANCRASAACCSYCCCCCDLCCQNSLTAVLSFLSIAKLLVMVHGHGSLTEMCEIDRECFTFTEH